MKNLIILSIAISGILNAQYHSYDDMTRTLKQLSGKHSHISISSIAKTGGGRDVWLVTIGRGEPKKGILVVGGIEGHSVVGSEHALRFVRLLSTEYSSRNDIKELIDRTTIYVIPRANPDASEAFFKKPLTERSTNNSPNDDDRDGVQDEDDVDDLNNDGIISMMRIVDPRGEWIVDPDDSRLMRKADAAKGEKGKYLYMTEGIDNDGDKEWNEDPSGGTDLNRNFTFNYQFFGKNSGVHQISEPESKAIADLLFDNPNIAAVFSFSSNDNLTTPWKHEPSKNESPAITSVMKEDEEYISYIGKKFSEITKLTKAPKPEKGEGSFSEWAYYHAGRWSFSVRPWWFGDVAPEKDTSSSADSVKGKSGMKKSDKEKTDDQRLAGLKWYDAAGIKDVAIPWQKFTHPDFPDRDVEIGGVKPFLLSNPPAESLDSYSKAYSEFILFLAAQSADISLSNQKVVKLSGNVYRVSVDVVNNGYFPTNSAIGSKTRWIRNVRVLFDNGKSNSISAGKGKQTLEAIKGSGGYKTVEWIIVGSGSVNVRAESPVAGAAQMTIDLK